MRKLPPRLPGTRKEFTSMQHACDRTQPSAVRRKAVGGHSENTVGKPGMNQTLMETGGRERETGAVVSPFGSLGLALTL